MDADKTKMQLAYEFSLIPHTNELLLSVKCSPSSALHPVFECGKMVFVKGGKNDLYFIILSIGNMCTHLYIQAECVCTVHLCENLILLRLSI